MTARDNANQIQIKRYFVSPSGRTKWDYPRRIERTPVKRSPLRENNSQTGMILFHSGAFRWNNKVHRKRAWIPVPLSDRSQ